MKGGVLGFLGGIVAIFSALFVILGIEMISIFGGFTSSQANQVYIIMGITIVAGILGITGGIIGKKLGGALMVIGGVIALIGAGFGLFVFGGSPRFAFGGMGMLVLQLVPFILMLVGGVLALRENVQAKTE